ncbi:MAG: glycerol-3-phosphate dehydrogenase/oxidase [Anaerolineae bacterium]|nr:glycerol-3-phosphate dehydrogenase/oxidase [Anaerolineae bacterium]
MTRNRQATDAAWPRGWRELAWHRAGSEPFDLIIVGGGVTGAGILQQAAKHGLRALLVEQKDFAWGTSSRSSKMVHGGLRYLKDGRPGLTLESVRERVRLLAAGPGLVEELGFLIAAYKGDKPGPTAYAAGLAIYDTMGRQWAHQRLRRAEFAMLAPYANRERLTGGFRYVDAQTDDARLVLRVLGEAVDHGGLALNYVRAEGLLHAEGRVAGVRLHDALTGQTVEACASVVINATGAWADRLRGELGSEARIRPLRGSHLAFPGWRFPVAQAINFSHPADRRPVFAFPWEGVTLVGTTDVDHRAPLDAEPGISPDEVAYLMAAVEHNFPSLGLTLDDVISTWAGVRPVIGTGKADPSKESREHALWEENGLLTVTGGKLTTFRVMALDALRAAIPHLTDAARSVRLDSRLPPFDLPRVALACPPSPTLQRRLLGRHGDRAAALVALAGPDELELIPGTLTLWAELRWAAHAEAVMRLDDLLLRRTRLGLLLPGGGEALLPRIRAVCQAELGWEDARWDAEQAAYLDLWRAHYSLPPRDAIPDWRAVLDSLRAAHAERAIRDAAGRRSRRVRALAAVLALAAGLIVWWARRKA